MAWNDQHAEDIRQAFWDVANIYERTLLTHEKELNILVRDNLATAQRALYQAYLIQSHVGEDGKIDNTKEAS